MKRQIPEFLKVIGLVMLTLVLAASSILALPSHSEGLVKYVALGERVAMDWSVRACHPEHKEITLARTTLGYSETVRVGIQNTAWLAGSAGSGAEVILLNYINIPDIAGCTGSFFIK